MLKKYVPIALVFCLMGVMMTLPLLITTTSAQGEAPTSTPISVQGEDDDSGNAAPGVDIVVTVSAVEVTEEADTETVTDDETAVESTPAPESAEDVAAPDTIGDAAPVCPVGVQDAFTATELLCGDLASGEACIGNGSISAVFGNEAANTGFSSSGDRTILMSVAQLSLDSTATWTAMRAQIRLATTDGGDIATGTLYAYGNVTMEDTGRVASTDAQQGTVIAQRGMNVRRTPGNEGVVVWQLGAGEIITVTGITADDQWIRIVIPNEFAGTGWVYAPYMEVENGVDTLPTVTVNSPVPDLTPPDFAPGQSYRLTTGAIPDGCEGDRAVSGVLFQTPSGTPDAMRLELNGVALEINGTVFITAQASEDLRVNVLEGSATATVDGSSATAFANNAVIVAMSGELAPLGTPNTESFNPANLGIVPTRLLPRQIVFDSGTAVAEPTAVPSGFGTPASQADTASGQACILTAPAVRNIRAGASTVFDVVQVLQEGETTEAVAQATGQEFNLTWYQTANGGWIRVDTVEESGNCGTLPVVEPPALPEPTSTPATDEADTTDDTASIGTSLVSSSLAPLTCDGTAITGSTTSDGQETYVVIGGQWSATAGTTVTYTTQGGMLRPELGDYIQLVDADGKILASSGEGRSLTITFDTNVAFEARFSGANGDTVLMAASCS
ncbi:MAG: SH3 domain-containing protein [Chloroflexota bacterium]